MNCLLCGVGGQGTVLASKLLAQAAIDKGISVKTAETIGMAQRGGSVVSHVRIGNEIKAPMIPEGEADIIIGFEPGEVVRNLNYLKEGGTVVVNTKPVMPTTASLGLHYDGKEMIEYLQKQNINLIAVDGEKICKELGSSKALNVVLLGAAANSNELGITKEEIKKAIETKLNPKFLVNSLLNASSLVGCASVFQSTYARLQKNVLYPNFCAIFKLSKLNFP